MEEFESSEAWQNVKRLHVKPEEVMLNKQVPPNPAK